MLIYSQWRSSTINRKKELAGNSDSNQTALRISTGQGPRDVLIQTGFGRHPGPDACMLEFIDITALANSAQLFQRDSQVVAFAEHAAPETQQPTWKWNARDAGWHAMHMSTTDPEHQRTQEVSA